MMIMKATTYLWIQRHRKREEEVGILGYSVGEDNLNFVGLDDDCTVGVVVPENSHTHIPSLGCWIAVDQIVVGDFDFAVVAAVVGRNNHRAGSSQIERQKFHCCQVHLREFDVVEGGQEWWNHFDSFAETSWMDFEGLFALERNSKLDRNQKYY